MRLWLAIRLFVRVLADRVCAAELQAILDGKPPSAAALPESSPPGPMRPLAPARSASRSEAITLLATLQREARFVDIVKEPLGSYSDAQIGAAARDVLRDCASVLERLFALRPLVTKAEGSETEVPAGYDAGRFRLTGNVEGEPPFLGTLVHAGWEATRCEVPHWSGSERSAYVVAAVEVQLK